MSLSLNFPLSVGSSGFESFTDEQTKEAIQQNFKMLLLTSPGEYVMDINFGVGIMRYLFELNTSLDKEALASSIVSQAAQYMPYVSISSIKINLKNIDYNSLSMKISYRTSKSLIDEIFELTVTT
jgi:hypothetical protein